MSLRFENITHTYRAAPQRKVLDIPALTLQQGDQILLRGVSGSGKTSFFNVASGLMQPTTGHIYYDATDLYRMTEAERDYFRSQNIGYIFQTHYLLNTLTALENVVMPLAFAKQTPSATWRARALDLLALFQLENHANHRPAQLSTGQRMRVAVARAIANSPRILFADEPTASLDQDSAKIVMDILQSTSREINATLLVASHDPALTPRFDQLADLTQGKITLHTQPAPLSEVSTPDVV